MMHLLSEKRIFRTDKSPIDSDKCHNKCPPVELFKNIEKISAARLNVYHWNSWISEAISSYGNLKPRAEFARLSCRRCYRKAKMSRRWRTAARAEVMETQSPAPARLRIGSSAHARRWTVRCRVARLRHTLRAYSSCSIENGSSAIGSFADSDGVVFLLPLMIAVVGYALILSRCDGKTLDAHDQSCVRFRRDAYAAFFSFWGSMLLPLKTYGS